MQISRLIRAVILVLTADKLFCRQTLADAVSNQANISSSSPTTLTWSRGVRKPQLNYTSKTKNIVARQADENNSTANNRAAPNTPAAAESGKPDDEDTDSFGIYLQVFEWRSGSAFISQRRRRYRAVHIYNAQSQGGWVDMYSGVTLIQQEQQRVTVGPGNAQFMSIRQVSLRRPPLLLQRCCCCYKAICQLTNY